MVVAALRGGMEPTYARCVHNVFLRTADPSLSDAADVFDAFEAITPRKPTRWPDHAERHRDEFLQRVTQRGDRAESARDESS